MANEENIQAPVPAAPDVQASPAASPEVQTPAPIETPVEPVVAPVEAPKEPESLLGAEPEEVKTEEVKEEKPAEETEQKPAEEPKVEGDKPAEPTDALPTFESFKLPENFKADEKVLGDFTKMLGEFEASKPDHVKFQEFGQKALEFHVAEVTKAAQQLTDYYVNLHQKQVNTWREELLKDPSIGKGDVENLKSYSKEMANFLARNGGSKEDVTNFRKVMSETGVGDSPALVRVLNNLKSKIERYENEASQMLPGTKPVIAKPKLGSPTSLYNKSSS